MKWVKKGHEYDEMYKAIEEKTSFYLFGAGEYGTHFVKIFKNEIQIEGYLDNDEKKQGKIINGYPCKAFNGIKLQKGQGIILTISQFARPIAEKQLQESGYRRNIDYFMIEDFLSIYYVYKYGKVYFSSVSFLPSTACNLNCKHCLNFNPFSKQFYVRDLEDLKKDIDLFFKCVDRIMLFHISGGEPMVYKHTADLIEYIDKNYGDRIDTLRTVTNGTIIPKEEVLEKLAQCNVEVTVDDYRDAVPRFKERFEEVISKFEEYKIKYYINKADSWIDLGPDKTDYSNWSDEELEKHRESCGQSWQELRDGKLYSCNYAAYATVAGIAGEQDLEEVYDLSEFTSEKKKELVEFRLGYTTKGYTEFCKKCRGFTPENSEGVAPAEQVQYEKNRYF